MDKIETIKNWCKEHETAVKEVRSYAINFGIGCVVGAIVGNVMLKKYRDELYLIETLKSFAKTKDEGRAIIKEVLEAQVGATYMENHRFQPGDCTLGELGDKLTEYWTAAGMDLNTEVTGLVLFDKRTK